VWITCLTCREPVSKKWLLLAMPWSTYTCRRCDAVLAGTLLRLVAVSLCTGILGYVLIAVSKGKLDPVVIPLPLILTLAVLFLGFPAQIKEIR
jgi:hypothetical protein